MSKPLELWNYYITLTNGDAMHAIEAMASDLVATAERVEALSQTGYFRRGQPTRVINLPPKMRPAPLDVPDQQAVDL